MTTRVAGYVKADGTSTALPRGVYDMAELGRGIQLDAELEKRLQELAASIDQRETKAKFKLEVFFRGAPRRLREERGIMSFWTNGGFLNGGGDAAVYLCPKRVGEASTICMSPIDMQFSTAREAVCVKCRQVTPPKELIGQIISVASTQKWAEYLTKMFYVLECSADLRINVSRHNRSIIEASEQERARYRAGEVYAKVAQDRQWITYPLAGILKDTATGASLEQRIKAFLEA